MQYFFTDFNDHFQAPEGFVTSIMVSLDSIRYNDGDQIVRKGDENTGIIFII